MNLDTTNIPFGEEYEAREILFTVGGEELMLNYVICRSPGEDWSVHGYLAGYTEDDEEVVIDSSGLSESERAELLRLALADMHAES
jgi:hypothetical protein